MNFQRCEICEKDLAILPFICKYCGKNFCVEHRLPEKHTCEKIEKVKENAKTIRSEDLIHEIIEFEKAKEKEMSEGPLKKLKKFKSKLTRRRKED